MSFWDTARVVVSCETGQYTAWQAKLLVYSCATRLGSAPLFVVHEHRPKRRHRYYDEIARAGGDVLDARSYRGSYDYAPRNTAGTLFEAARALRGSGVRNLVLCDPDMIFARAPELPDALSGDRYDYVFAGELRARFAPLAARVGVELASLEENVEALRVGVPHVVPLSIAEDLAIDWLGTMDALAPTPWRSEFYTLSMHAFGLAALRLGVVPTVTREAQLNHEQHAPLARAVVHYCYGDELWNKRWFGSDSIGPEGVWSPPNAPPGSVLGEVVRQLREAEAWFAARGEIRAIV